MSDPFSSNRDPFKGEADPAYAAQSAMKPALPGRFYKDAGVEEREGVFHLTLDGRTAMTPARRPLALPNRPLAEAVAEEWRLQGDVIDPATMPVTRLINSAIDGVSARREEVIDDLVRYAGSDLICYRAEGPSRLVEAQNATWDPVLEWVRNTHDARFTLSGGVMHVAQPESAIAAIRAAVELTRSPFALAALHVMTTLTGSILIPLAHVAGRLDAEEAWNAAHVDERYQESVWGEDREAMVRRAKRRVDFDASSQVYRLSTA